MSERPDLPRRAAAEALGTFSLVFFVGGAAAAAAAGKAELGLPAQAAVSGLAVAAMIYAIGHLSGAHINPAVTLAFVLSRHFPTREALAYVASQLAAAAAAGIVLALIWSGQPGDLGANSPSVGTGTALLYEFLLTAVLMFVIMAVATDTRAVGAAAAIAIGATVTPDILVGGGVSGASMNPARSFGPAVGSGNFSDLWLFFLGPIAGAAAGAAAYQFIRGES